MGLYKEKKEVLVIKNYFYLVIAAMSFNVQSNEYSLKLICNSTELKQHIHCKTEYRDPGFLL